MSGFIVSINLSRGGVPKLPVLLARIHELGIEGDAQKYTDIHGGPDRAVCLYSLEAIDKLRAMGHPIAPGTIGENVTVSKLDWPSVIPGAILRVGAEARLQITRYTKPCKTIRGSFSDGDFRRVFQDLSPGMSRVYAKVLTTGDIKIGDVVELELPANS